MKKIQKNGICGIALLKNLHFLRTKIRLLIKKVVFLYLVKLAHKIKFQLFIQTRHKTLFFFLDYFCLNFINNGKLTKDILTEDRRVLKKLVFFTPLASPLHIFFLTSLTFFQLKKKSGKKWGKCQNNLRLLNGGEILHSFFFFLTFLFFVIF